MPDNEDIRRREFLQIVAGTMPLVPLIGPISELGTHPAQTQTTTDRNVPEKDERSWLILFPDKFDEFKDKLGTSAIEIVTHSKQGNESERSLRRGFVVELVGKHSHVEAEIDRIHQLRASIETYDNVKLLTEIDHLPDDLFGYMMLRTDLDNIETVRGMALNSGIVTKIAERAEDEPYTKTVEKKSLSVIFELLREPEESLERLLTDSLGVGTRQTVLFSTSALPEEYRALIS